MKAKNRKTGEIVDIISYSGNTTRSNILDYVSYIDSKGEEHPNVKGLNLYRDFEIIEPNISKVIDWEQRRYEVAKAVMQGILSNEDEVSRACQEADYGDKVHTVPKAFAQYAVACADALIKELKKK